MAKITQCMTLNNHFRKSALAGGMHCELLIRGATLSNSMFCYDQEARNLAILLA
jgi:hypothetical protein